ncbi:MAG: rane protein [Proteobacteria bacterium]|nr:rane protein [Pseudomonadota bacterium]
MTQATRSEAQQRADEIRVFRREADRLQRAGVLELSAAQAAAVAEYHRALLAGYAQRFDIDQDVKAGQLSLGMRVASLLGALALAASVLFLFYQFWGGLPTAVQVGLLVCAALGSFIATLWLQGRDHSGYFTKLAALLAFVCFVLNVVMLGQIFNITPSDQALLAWAAYALLLAYSCDLRLLLAAGILCVIAYISARTGTWSGMYWLSFGERPENFLPAALLLFIVPSLLHRRRFAEFLPIYRVFGLLTALLPVLVLSHWGGASYLDLDNSVIEGGYQLFGFALSASAIWLGARRGWPEVINTGITFFVIFLYTKLYDWCWEIMPKYLFFLVVGLLAVLILLILKRLRTASLSSGGAR